MEVKRTERGWPGHFIAAPDCLFRRNTLLQTKKHSIVVSTVGCYVRSNGEMRRIEPIGYNRYYETMVFHSDQTDDLYHDANVSLQIYFDSPWSINHKEKGVDNEANDMHEALVAELTTKLKGGDI